MPDFEIVSLQDAKLKTLSGRQRTYINEYAGYIQQLSHGKAGKLHPKEDEKLTTIRRRLVVTAQTLEAKLIIRRSGDDMYFWREDGAEEQPRRRPTRRRRSQEETAAPDQPFSPDQIEVREPERFDRGETEESPELGQTS
jgi:hypothetical protein